MFLGLSVSAPLSSAMYGVLYTTSDMRNNGSSTPLERRVGGQTGWAIMSTSERAYPYWYSHLFASSRRTDILSTDTRHTASSPFPRIEPTSSRESKQSVAPRMMEGFATM